MARGVYLARTRSRLYRNVMVRGLGREKSSVEVENYKTASCSIVLIEVASAVIMLMCEYY